MRLKVVLQGGGTATVADLRGVVPLGSGPPHGGGNTGRGRAIAPGNGAEKTAFPELRLTRPLGPIPATQPVCMEWELYRIVTNERQQPFAV